MFKFIRQYLSLADIILFLIMIAATALSAKYYWQPQQERMVYIYKDNLLFGEYSLSQERIILIDDHNTVQIKDHRVRMLKADCPDQRCLKQGFSSMLPIICLPNNLVIEIKNRESEHIHIVR